MDNIRNQICGRIQLFVVCVAQCVCLGFDSSFSSIFLHEKLIGGPLLFVGNCLFNGALLLGILVVWVNAYARWDVWACAFGLISLKVLLFCLLAIDLLNLVFLTLIGCVGFCIGSEQALIFDLALRRIPNPAKKLLLPLCYLSYSIGNLASALFLDQNASQSNDYVQLEGNWTIYHPSYKSFNILQQFQTHSRLDSSYVLVGFAVIQCFLGYSVYDLWKTNTVDSRSLTEENETIIRGEYATHVEWISSGMTFFSSGLIATFPYYVFVFSLTDLSILYFYAFLVGCLAGRLLYLVCATKFPPMFWLCFSLIICGVSICCFSFEELRLFSPALLGMSLALIQPIVTTLVSRQKGASIHPLLCASIISSIFYPIVVTQVIQNYGTELYTTVNFLTLLIMVCLFVCLLNLQSSEKPQDENHAKIWVFFQGQGLKRAHSVRKFISTFRESLRGSSRSYRRLRRFQRSPQPQSTLTATNPLANRSYRSIESARKTNFLQLTRRLYNSVDEEPTTSLSLSPMPNDDEEHSQISHLDDD